MKPNPNSFYARKILFNIAAADDAALQQMVVALKIEQSEFIRRAIRAYVAHHRVEMFKAREEAANG